jgi:hypothetical protein
MNVYDIQNITVEEMGNPVFAYRIRTVEGFVIKLPAYPENVYQTVAILYTDYDFSTVQIIAESDLPEGAEIYGNTDNYHVIA